MTLTALWNGLSMGLLYGILHIVGPDHLGTLMTLSLVESRVQAFKVGAAWSLGHCTGLVVIAGILIGLRSLIHVSVESWEHYGNYFIGLTLILCPLYFLYYESSHVEDKDGESVAKPCSCHGAEVCSMPPLTCGMCEDGENVAEACPYHGAEACSMPPLICGVCEEGEPWESMPLLPKDAVGQHDSAPYWRWVHGAMLGMLQGVCCPIGLIGISFLAGMEIRSTMVFLVVFLLVSVLGTGLFAMGWCYLTRIGFASCVSQRALYRTSCVITLVLGVAWIVANACGVLDLMNYSEVEIDRQATKAGDGSHYRPHLYPGQQT
mmetsp:Transcript_86294/g.279409  ORF Transcript_86294/g.279409 Transcript_86294/m.279409 type:complete len:320 (+) Transcript_86294:113-1072(+)